MNFTKVGGIFIGVIKGINIITVSNYIVRSLKYMNWYLKFNLCMQKFTEGEFKNAILCHIFVESPGKSMEKI